MTAADLLARLRDLGIEVRADGDELRLRGHGGELPPVLRQAVVQQKPAMLALLRAPAELPTCPSCGRTDYMPIGSGWRRCWSCARRWGPSRTPDPGDPPDLRRIGQLLRIPRRRREEV